MLLQLQMFRYNQSVPSSEIQQSIEDGNDRLYRNIWYLTTNLRCVTSQKSEEVTHKAAEA